MLQFAPDPVCDLWEHSALLSTIMKLPIVIKIFVLSIFEWPLYTGFTVISGLKGIYYCLIEIVKGFTDKGQFQYLTKLKGPQVGNYTCIPHKFFH